MVRVSTRIGDVEVRVPGAADTLALLEDAYGKGCSDTVHFPMCTKGEHATYLDGHFVGACVTSAKFRLDAYVRLVAAGRVPACEHALRPHSCAWDSARNGAYNDIAC